ncbi:MAG: ComEC/Rec2 family competence protein [Capnocytophaga sp.]|nr:ComEC/Rec2 family competence protein [Capnocytophaga sp.]
MKRTPLNFPLLLIVLGFIFGIIFQDNFLFPIFYNILSCFLTLFLVFISFFVFSRYAKITTFIFSFCFGMFLYSVHYEPNTKNNYTKILTQNKEYILQGIIEEVKNSTLFVKLHYADNKEVTGKISLRIKDTISVEEIGKSILFTAKLNEITPPKNPYQFDFQKYMQRQSIYWQSYAIDYQIQDKFSFSVVLWAKKIQNKLASSLDKYPFSKESRGIIKALVLGIRSDIDSETYQEYIDAGAVHILAISGLHIGIITILITKIVDLFLSRKRKTAKVAIIFSILLTYAFVAGLSASVLRAVVMFGGYSAAELLENKRARYDSLIFSVFILLLFKPVFLFDVGFQLSYMAVLSILIFLPLYNQYFIYKNLILNSISSTIKVSIAAQIGIIPISFYYFHQFAGLFLVTNIIILPFMGIILGVGIFVVLLSYFNILPLWIVKIYDFLIFLMNWVIEKVSSYKTMIINEVYFDKMMLFISFVILIFLVFYLYLRKIKFLYLTLISVIFFQIYLIYDKYKEGNISQIVVFQQYRSTLLAKQDKGLLTFFHSDSLKLPNAQTNNFLINKHIKSADYEPIKNVLAINKKYILIIDEAIYPENINADYVLLRNSPKINLEKFLEKNSTKMLIIDGSNIPSMVKRWQKTAEKYKISFHYTQEKGAFIIE